MTVKELKELLEHVELHKEVEVRIDGEDTCDTPIVDYRITPAGLLLIINA